MFLYAVAQSAYTTFALDKTKLEAMWKDFQVIADAEKLRQSAGME